MKEILEEIHTKINIFLIHLNSEVENVLKNASLYKEFKVFKRRPETISYAL